MPQAQHAIGYTGHAIHSSNVDQPLPPPIYDTVLTGYGDAKKISPNGEAIIGLKDPSLTINATGTLTTSTFDTTTYGDRAIIKLTNSTGSAINLTGLCIKGKPVMQLAGQNGYVWEYSDYDAIEKEGEKFIEVSNDFIFDPVQAKQIGDFVWKELKPHKLYSLMLVGCQYQYEIGDVYHLTIEHTMNGGTMENIDTDVEVMGVSIDRSVGNVGMTNLNLRVPSEAWALTLAKNSKLVGAGNAQRLNNRSNVVTVASSTWTGQADYFCDGTDDNVEIQAAIDYIYTLGGGKVLLTAGRFIISTVLTIKENITLEGSDYGTLLSPSSNITIRKLINATGKGLITNFTIDGNSLEYDIAVDGSVVDGNYYLSINNIEVKNYVLNTSSIGSTTFFYIFFEIDSASNCFVHDTTGSKTSSGALIVSAFGYVRRISNCSAYSLSSSGSDYYMVGFNYCNNISSCSSYSFNADAIYGLRNCSYLSSCSSTGHTARLYYGFYGCNNITVCSSTVNSGSTVERGFDGCKSVQQCKSDDTTKYTTSYADSGTANACADTSAGGYNS